MRGWYVTSGDVRRNGQRRYRLPGVTIQAFVPGLRERELLGVETSAIAAASRRSRRHSYAARHASRTPWQQHDCPAGGRCSPPAGAWGRRPAGNVTAEASIRCQRNSCGHGQISKGSLGASTHFHQTCRLAHAHSDRHIRRPSSSRRASTRPPGLMGRPHSGHSRKPLVMRPILISTASSS